MSNAALPFRGSRRALPPLIRLEIRTDGHPRTADAAYRAAAFNRHAIFTLRNMTPLGCELIVGATDRTHSIHDLLFAPMDIRKKALGIETLKTE